MSKLCVTYTTKEIARFQDVLSYESRLAGPMGKVLQLKNRFKIFENIPDGELIHIIKDVHIHKFPESEIIIQEGAISEEIFFVLLGECQITVNNKTVGYIKAGQIFGEIAALFQKPRTATVTSSKNTATALSFKINHIMKHKFQSAFIELYKNMASELAVKLEYSNQKKAF